MANIEQKNLFVWLKSMSRANPLPLDASSVWETREAAETYATKANAYGGQILTALVDGKYKTFVLQPSDSGYTLEEVGAVQQSDLTQYVQVVDALPETGMIENVLYINTTDSKGYYYHGGQWVVAFQNVETKVDEITTDVANIKSDLENKASTANPVFTGTVTLGQDPTENLQAATKQYVDRLVDGIVNCAPGIAGNDNPLPTADYKAGQTWRVADAGTYAGQTCETGDLIICLKDYDSASASDADFMVVQANVDGSVTSAADASTDGNIVVFDGITGRIIRDSQVSIASLNDAIAKAHTHTNKDILDTYDKSQTDLLAAAKAEAKSMVDTLANTVDGKADKATTLAGYGITDAYTKTETDDLLNTIRTNLNSKVDASTVDDKISTAKEEITTAYETAMAEKIGEIPVGTTVKQYIDSAIGTGDSDVATAIATAKAEAIAASKEYTDTALNVVEF